MRAIFINYRRSDAEGEAGRLFDELTLQLGSDAVFMDVAAIEPGRDFRKAIDQSVSNCSVLLAMIGLEWLSACDAAGQRRLDDPNDFVRIELASALRRDIPVVPVLVRGAKMPRADELSEDLRELAFRNAVELTHARWKSDVQVLLNALRPHLDTPAAPAATRPAGQVAAPMAAPSSVYISAIEPAVIERVARELAAFIGPIAEVVVKRAAKRSATPQELYTAAAAEIETEAERLRFLKACRG
ncbi:MAG TPA: TIR domain-containing protein [Terracidiphilus sp.]|nr:TIR domain-containing protein [Terracidiphilus sp.]